MKRTTFLLLAPLVGCLFSFSSCKSSDPVPEFGVPEDGGDGGWFSRSSRDARSDKWSKKRAGWARREQEKFDQMFDRMRGEPYH